MRITGDISGLDEFNDMIDDAYFAVLSQVGRDATKNAKRQKTYQRRTGNLENANGGCVVRNGRIIDMWVETDNAHPQAVERTENLLIYSEKPKDGLYLANGMEYASFVESKGFAVILSNGVLFAERNIKKKLNIR